MWNIEGSEDGLLYNSCASKQNGVNERKERINVTIAIYGSEKIATVDF